MKGVVSINKSLEIMLEQFKGEKDVCKLSFKELAAQFGGMFIVRTLKQEL